jgi:hypothetical protein
MKKDASLSKGDWKWERSSGYAGWCCRKCATWISDGEDFICDCDRASVFEDPKLGLALEKKRANQIDINFKYVFGIIEKIHDNLCPEGFGTWQTRCEQALSASEEIRKQRETK